MSNSNQIRTKPNASDCVETVFLQYVNAFVN